MTETIKFVEHTENVQRGNILQCKGVYPYEDLVYFMLMEYPCGEVRKYALMVVSGYKAGLIFVVFPQEANAKVGIDVEWLKTNWSKWGYAECPLEEVYVILNNPPKPLLH